MSEYDIAIKIAGQLEGSFKNAIKGAQSGLSGLGISGKVGSLALKGVGVAAKATAATMAAAGAGIAAVGAYSVNVGKEFESQMSTVQAISGATGDDFEALKAKAKEMGATTSFSASEAGQAMEYMAMAGWKTEDMLGGIGGVMNLAAASGEDLASVSDIVTDALTAFGKGADYAGTFADQLAAASSSANVSVSTLGESFKYAAPIAGALGFSTSDTAEALALMGNAGIKASSAGTALRSTMNALTADELKFATSQGEVVVATQNEDGSMRNLNDILDDSRKAFANMTEAQQAQAAKALVGKNAMSGFLALMNAAPGDLDKVRSALEDSAGAAEEMANLRLDNLEGDITLLKSAAESFGISVYENMQGPLREVVQYGKEQLGILQAALDSGGFEGLTKAIGGVLSDAITKIAEAAPDFINGAADLVESFLNGIDNNADGIGSSIGRLITTLGSAIIRLAPKIAVTGVHIIAAIGKGIVDNLPMLKDAALDAVEYLWNAIKDGFKSFKDFLGDDEVEPFKKVLALIPGLVAGFAIFDGIGGAIKGFVTNFKGAGKAMPGAAKGFSKAGNQMSKVAKNILAVGAGLALAAAGIWLLVDAAKQIASAGPGAVAALLLMVGGLTALMVIASVLGPKLEAAKGGLLAFGGAILMAAAGMALMSFAAIQLANAGPLAFAGLAVMIGGMIALMAIAGAMGTTLATAAPGLLAFGAAILMVSAGFAIMAFAAIQLSQAGTSAMIMFAGLLVGLIAFMAVAALLGPMLISGGVGMLLLGAGLMLAAGAMALLANTAIMMSNAGAGAIVMLVALVAIILAFGAAAGLLAPLLMAGGVALMVFGAGLAVVAAAALLASVSLLLISTTLPTFAQYGMTAAAGIAALGASMLVVGAGAAVAGAGLLVAAAGLAALAVSALLAMVPMVAIGAAFVGIGAATAILAASGQTAADALDRLTDYGVGAMASMAALAAAVALPTVPLVALAAAFVATTVASAAFAVSILAVDAGLAAMVAVLALSVAALAGINMAIAMFRTQAAILGIATRLAGQAFVQFGTMVSPVASQLMNLVAPMTAVGAAAAALAAGMISTVASAATLAGAMAAVSVAVAAALVAFKLFGTGITQGMTQANTAVRNGMNQMRTIVVQGMTQITTVTIQGVTRMVAVFRSGGTQAIAIAVATANGIRAAFASVDLYSAGVNMMQGLLNGMNSMKAQVEAAARDIAKTAADAVNNALQVHSPSRLMVETGQFTGEGLALGMQNRTSDVQTAAQAMTQPVQDQSQQMRDMTAPQMETRSGLIGETLEGMSGQTTTNNTTQTSAPTFNFNPTYVIEGNADKEVLEETNKMSQSEFERMANEWIRNNGRVAFA